MRAGDRVELHVRYNDSWSAGFEIVAAVPGGFQVRRRSDGSLLPAPTAADDIRAEESLTSEVRMGPRHPR